MGVLKPALVQITWGNSAEGAGSDASSSSELTSACYGNMQRSASTPQATSTTLDTTGYLPLTCACTKSMDTWWIHLEHDGPEARRRPPAPL